MRRALLGTGWLLALLTPIALGQMPPAGDAWQPVPPTPAQAAPMLQPPADAQALLLPPILPPPPVDEQPQINPPPADQRPVAEQPGYGRPVAPQPVVTTSAQTELPPPKLAPGVGQAERNDPMLDIVEFDALPLNDAMRALSQVSGLMIVPSEKYQERARRTEAAQQLRTRCRDLQLAAAPALSGVQPSGHVDNVDPSRR